MCGVCELASPLRTSDSAAAALSSVVEGVQEPGAGNHVGHPVVAVSRVRRSVERGLDAGEPGEDAVRPIIIEEVRGGWRFED